MLTCIGRDVKLLKIEFVVFLNSRKMLRYRLLFSSKMGVKGGNDEQGMRINIPRIIE